MQCGGWARQSGAQCDLAARQELRQKNRFPFLVLLIFAMLKTLS